jgi:hypothetical protein
MKGGHANSGPAPDPMAMRRDRDKTSWTRLPAAGRSGPIPDFPLARPSAREKVLWEREWRRPQALMWEHNGQEIEVALYVRSVVAAEKTKAPANLRTLVRQQQDALGLSAPGMARLRWLIVDAVEPRAEQRPTGTEGATVISIRDRVARVQGGGAGG